MNLNSISAVQLLIHYEFEKLISRYHLIQLMSQSKLITVFFSLTCIFLFANFLFVLLLIFFYYFIPQLHINFKTYQVAILIPTERLSVSFVYDSTMKSFESLLNLQSWRLYDNFFYPCIECSVMKIISGISLLFPLHNTFPSLSSQRHVRGCAVAFQLTKIQSRCNPFIFIE